MVVHDAATFPGLVLTCRIMGILQIEQKSKGKAERNDRLFADAPALTLRKESPRRARAFETDPGKSYRNFFGATDELEDKKLDIIGWNGPKVALKTIKDGAKSFAEIDQ